MSAGEDVQGPVPTEARREFHAPLLRVRRGLGVAFQAAATPAPAQRPSRLAKDLALGYRIVKAVERGEMEGFSALGRAAGLHPSRVSVLVALSFLAPDLQAVLLGLEAGFAGRALKLKEWVAIARIPRWVDQRGVWERMREERNTTAFRDPGEAASSP